MSRGRSITKVLLDSSQAAFFAAVEIHNKPHIAYRYPTATILLINSWELALKAYIYKYISKKMIYESDGIHTKGFTKVINIVRDHINGVEKNKKFQSVYDNLCLLNDYRNSNVHFMEKKLDPIVFMLISKAVINYDIFIKKYFGKDVTKDDNLIILPVGMKLPFNPIEYLQQDYGSAHNEFVNYVIQCIKSLNEIGVQDSIVVGFDVYAERVKNINNADIVASIENADNAVKLKKSIRVTDNPNAPIYRVEPDFPPLDYYTLRDKAKEKYPQMKFGKVFNDSMKIIKNDTTLCKSNFLNPHKRSGQKKDFYDEKAIDELIRVYKELEDIE